MFLKACTDSKYLSSILFTKRFIEIVGMIIPLILVVSVSITLFKIILDPDMKNEKNYLNGIYSKTLAAVAIFFVPVLVEALLSSAGLPGVTSSKCWKNANTATIASYKEAERIKEEAEEESRKAEKEKADQERKIVEATREAARARNEKENAEAQKKALEAAEEASSGSTGTASATAAELIRVAESKVGIKGRPNEITYAFGKQNGSYSYAWCSEFVWYCSSLSGVYPTKVTKKAAGNQIYIKYFKSKGQYQISAGHGGNYIPKMGDYIFFDSSGNPNAGTHIGIVKGVSGNKVIYIDGNHGDKVVDNNTMALNNKRIIGYGVWE